MFFVFRFDFLTFDFDDGFDEFYKSELDDFDFPRLDLRFHVL